MLYSCAHLFGVAQTSLREERRPRWKRRRGGFSERKSGWDGITRPYRQWREGAMAVWGWVIVAIVVVVLATLAWGMLRTRRTRRLRPQSGPEHDREAS